MSDRFIVWKVHSSHSKTVRESRVATLATDVKSAAAVSEKNKVSNK